MTTDLLEQEMKKTYTKMVFEIVDLFTYQITHQKTDTGKWQKRIHKLYLDAFTSFALKLSEAREEERKKILKIAKGNDCASCDLEERILASLERKI